MSRSVKFVSRHIARWAVNSMARVLAVVSVFLLGRSGEAAARNVEEAGRNMPTYTIGHVLGGQISYVQTGQKDGEDWPRPWPE